MANSVGSVSIDLEANIAKFTSDIGRAARVAEQRSKEIQRTFASVAGAIGVGISVVGIQRWIGSAIDAQDEISKFSQKVGVSTEALSGWQLAAQQAGVGNEALEKGLVKLSQSADAVSQGSKTQADAFKAIGVSVLDSNNQLKGMDRLFSDVTAGLAKMEDGTRKTAVSTQIFGRAGADLIPLLNAGTQGLKEYADMAEAFGLTVNGDSAKAAEAFNDSMEQLSFVGKGLANTIATELAPAFAELAERAVEVFKGKAWHDWMDSVGDAASYVARNIDKIVTVFKVAGEVITAIYVGKLIRSGAAWIVSLSAQAAAVVRTATISTSAMNAMAIAPLKLIGVFGGLPAVMTQAAIAVGYLMFKQTDAEKAASDLADTTSRLARAQGDVTEYAIKQAKAQLDAERATLAQAKAHLEAINSTRGYVTGAQNMDSMAIAAATASRGVDDLKVSIQGLEKQVQLSVIAKAFQDNLDFLNRGARESAENFDALRKSLKDQNAQLSEAVATYGKGKAAVLEYKQSLEIAAVAADGDNNITKQRIATIKALYAPNIALAKQLDSLTAAQKSHTAASREAIDVYGSLYEGLQRITDAADPAQKAYNDFANTVRGMAKIGAEAISKGADVATVQGVISQAVTGANQKLVAELGKPMIAAKEYADALDEQLIARKRLIDAQVSAIGMGTQEAANQQELAQVYQESTDALAKLQRQHELHPEAFGDGQYEAEVDALKKHNDAMLQTTIDGQAAISAAQADWHNGVNKAMSDFMEQQNNVAAQSEEIANTFLKGFPDAFAAFASGTESAKDAFGSLIDSMYQQALKAVANQAMAKLLGMFGNTGTGASAGGAGGWAGLASSFAGMFGPSTIGSGFATGGLALPGSIHPVNETGPEIFTYQNRDYLAAGAGSVKVTPITSGGSAGNTFVTNVNVQPTSTRRTADQVAQEVARKQRVATSRTG